MSLRRAELVLGSTVRRSLFSPSGQGGSGGSAGVTSSLLIGLKAYYAFETLTTDSSGNGNTLTNNNAVTQASGIIGQAAKFVAASSQFLSINDNSTIDFTTKVSISLWVNLTTVGANQCLISKGILSTDLEWAVQVLAAAHPRFSLGSITGAISADANGVTFTTGNWNHIVCVFDGTAGTGNTDRAKMWVNGTQQTLSYGGVFPAANTPGANPMNIGKLGGAVPQFTNALIDELGLWNVGLTQSQITSLYNGGAAVTYPFTGVP